jgi:uncharacterized protein YggE
MRLRFLAAALLAAALPPVAHGQPAGHHVMSATGPLVTLSAEARVERAPDLAVMSAGVVTQAPTASEAMRLNAERMSQVVAAVRRAGVAERDIQTSGLSLQPQYDYQDRRAPRLTGYQATNQVSVRLRELDRAGRVIDSLVEAGANQVSGPGFEIAEPDAALDAARSAAVAKARARADLYARALGLRVKRVVSLSEGFERVPPPMPVARMAVAMESVADTPVAPGEVSLTARVTLTVELE